MSQRDLAAELRASRVTAPDEVRERVRLIAAGEATPPRRFTWRRALVVALPVTAAIAAAIVFTRPSAQPGGAHTPSVVHGDRARAFGTQTTPLQAQLGAPAQKLVPAVPAPPYGRVVRYGASLSLRVPTPNDVSSAVKRALAIASSLGGYPVSVRASTHPQSGSADLTLKIPRQHVQEAVQRLSALGTITGEQVDLQDLQAGLNATDREIARLQLTLANLRAQAQTDAVKRQIAALTTRIASLQRSSAGTRRSAHYATVSLHLATPRALPHHKPHHGPLYWLVVALKWLAIGAVYVLVLGAPVLLVAWVSWIVVRTIRRRREDELLSGR